MEQKYDVFISSKSEDYHLAEQIYDFLKENNLSVFLASKELDRLGDAQFAAAIDRVLDNSSHMVVVASSLQHIKSKWVQYEWSLFSNDLKSGYRTGNLLTVLSDSVQKNVLPPSLRHQQSFSFNNYTNGILHYLTCSNADGNQPPTPSPQINGHINGHAYVDLGLSVKWATCNVGATKPEDYGEYFAWGETNTKADYSEDTYVHCETKKGLFGNVKYRYDRMADIGGDSRYDVARARWGGSWRKPTKSELEELEDKCQWQWTTVNGVAGYKVTGPNGNSIFLPAAGYRYGSNLNDVGLNGSYSSSTPGEDDDRYAFYLYFNDKSQGVLWSYRGYGLSVRPVSE